MPYLIDANVFIQAKNLHYGLDFCPAFWELARQGQHVRAGLQHREGRRRDCSRRRRVIGMGRAAGAAFFLPPAEAIVRALGTVGAWATQQSYGPAAVSTFLQVADCYLVAHALAHHLRRIRIWRCNLSSRFEPPFPPGEPPQSVILHDPFISPRIESRRRSERHARLPRAVLIGS